MKIYQCDWCSKQTGCSQMRIDAKQYDICDACRTEITDKLKGKGEAMLQQFASILNKDLFPQPLLRQILPNQPPLWPGQKIYGGALTQLADTQREQNA